MKIYIVSGFVGYSFREWAFRTYKLLPNAERRYNSLITEYQINAKLEEYDLSNGTRKTLKKNFNVRAE